MRCQIVFRGGRVQTGRPVAAKIHIDPPRLDHRRGRGVTVHAVAQRLRLVGMKQFLIEPHLAALGIQAEDEEIVSVLRCRGQPDLAAHHHRRGPAAIRDRRLPLHVLRLAPTQRQSGRLRILCRRGMTVAERPAKLRPILSSRNGREQQQRTDQAKGESHRNIFLGTGRKITYAFGKVAGTRRLWATLQDTGDYLSTGPSPPIVLAPNGVSNNGS